MELLDKDLQSVQEVRLLLAQASKAQEILSTFTQVQIDKIVEAMTKVCIENATRLAKMAYEETGFGIWQDKVIKNLFGSKGIYEAIKEEKTVGILRDDKKTKVLDIGIGAGIVAAIVPSTNPTSTAMYKTLISIKAGNCIVFSPHPGAKNCTEETVRLMQAAAIEAGCPKGAISCISIPTMQATKELMTNKHTKLILATGGSAMVKSAYSSGVPAIGVGAGNGPAFIDKSADVVLAVKRIIDSKTFDNGSICASEQSVIVEQCMEEKVVKEMEKQGAYFLNEMQANQLSKFILRSNGTMNPQIVGQSVAIIAKRAGLTTIPSTAKLLVAKESRVGEDAPFSREKLAPILAFYVESSLEEVIKKVQKILLFEGKGHTFCMHINDEERVKKIALVIPASRILINTPGALGGIGATTNLFPALTLGCGAVGGSSSSNNIGPLDLINIKRVAYGVTELEELRKEVKTEDSSCHLNNMVVVEEIVKRVMQELI